MRMEDAIKIMEQPITYGFRVHFETVLSGILESDYFPERGEPLIETEADAWELAERFAKNTFGKRINIYVINSNWVPVAGCAGKSIYNR